MLSSRKAIPLTLNLDLHQYQAQVDQCQARFIYLLCGRRWGKTILLAWKMARAIAKPRSTVWYVTSQLKQARDIIWRQLLEILEPSKRHFKAVETTLEIHFDNGSIIAIKGAKDPDCRRGPSLDFLAIDECQDFIGQDFMTIFRPLLTGKQGSCILAGTKRIGSWFLNEWLSAEKGEIAHGFPFWFPSTKNPLIPPEEWEMTRKYLQNKGRLDIWENEYVCDPHTRTGNDVELKYPEFDHSLHVIAPFTIPSSYRHFVALDWGMEHPSGAIWAAVSPEGRVFVYDEYREYGKDMGALARDILEKNRGRKIEAYVLDSHCWARESDGKSAALRFMQEGLKPAIKGLREDKVFTGTSLVKSYFRPISGEPMIQIFPNCRHLTEELVVLRWRDRIHDDMTDALRYLLGFLSTLTWKSKFHQNNGEQQSEKDRPVSNYELFKRSLQRQKMEQYDE